LRVDLTPTLSKGRGGASLCGILNGNFTLMLFKKSVKIVGRFRLPSPKERGWVWGL